ncbi:MAG: MBL fold metallo-hydrolase [Candidatus Dormibacteria bacterium]
MELAFLGTGSAFSLHRQNGAVLVDGHLLLDAGAALLPGLTRVGRSPLSVRSIFLTHFHGDHLLGLPALMGALAFWPESGAPPPAAGYPIDLEMVGPPGTTELVDTLCHMVWGDPMWALWLERVRCRVEEVAPGSEGEFASGRFRVLEMNHFSTAAQGYVFEMGGRTLGYSGDTEPCPGLDQLVELSEVVILEATAPSGEAPGHMTRAQAELVARENPGRHFFFNHLLEATPEPVNGVVLPEDFGVYTV